MLKFIYRAKMYKIDRIELAEKSRLVLCGKKLKASGWWFALGRKRAYIRTRIQLLPLNHTKCLSAVTNSDFVLWQAKPNRL